MRRASRPFTAVVAFGLLVATAAAALAALDPYRPQQWGLDRIGAPSAWERTVGAGVVVAVLDTGVDLDHPDLRERLVRDGDGRVLGRDFVDGDAVPQDENGHGTMVAGIAVATADNGEGIAGVAPGATLLPVRVLGPDGSGRYAHLDEGIRWAVDAGADVINLSLERAEETGALGRTLEGLTTPVSAVQYAWDHGVVVVAAAGNSGNDVTDYPEGSPVLLVGATDQDDRKAGFSDAGRADGVVAPGIEIVSAWCDPQDGGCASDHRYGVASGTSFAAPSVAGAVALLLAQGLDHEQAVARIRGTARDLGAAGPDTDTGHGLLDVDAATSDTPATPRPTPSPSPSPSGEIASADQQRPTATTPAPAETAATPASEDPSPGPPSAAPTATAAPTPTDPSPVAVPVAPGGDDRSGWLGLATVLLAVTAASVGINVYRHGGPGSPGREAWGRPPVKSRR